jgi:putative two-component system response regulator
MPVLDGYSVCQILKEEPSTAKIPILVCTVRSDNEDQLRAAASGADAFLAKPVSPDTLTSKVFELLGNRKTAPGR